jgi:hypothetical protein
MTIEAELADGRVLEFPDGTDPLVIQATVKRLLSESGDASIESEAQQSAQPTDFPEERGATTAALELPELGDGGLLSGEDKFKVAMIAPALLLTPDDQELASIITTQFPSVGLQYSPAGEMILANNKTGAKVIVNKPGLSRLDLLQAVGIGSAFLPAGVAATAGTGAAKLGAKVLGQRALQGAGASALTQSGIEGAQDLAGGDFDAGEIGTAAAFGAGAELAIPAIGAFGGKIRDFIRAKPAEEAAKVIATGEKEGVRVLTSDVVPPETWLGKSIQSLGEKIGFIGTGGARAIQQKERQEVVQGLADEFGIVSVNDDFLPEIIKSLQKKQAAELAVAAKQRNAAVDQLVKFGDVPVNQTTKTIEREVAKQERLGAKANQELLTNLNNIKESINGNFSLVKDIRTEVISDLKAISRSEDQRATAALQAVKSAIDKDLIVFARNNDKGALKDWLQSNRKFAFELGKAKNTELKRLIQNGEVSPKVVGPILRGGDPTELKRLFSSLTPKGQNSARAAIIKDALEASGSLTSANPDRLSTILNKPKTQRVINEFFKGEDKEALDGLTRLLDSTRRAQSAAVATKTGEQAILPVSIGAAIAEPFTAFITGSSLAAITRGYESKAVRTVLLKLAASKKGSKEEIELLKQLQPLMAAATQAAQQTKEGDTK